FSHYPVLDPLRGTAQDEERLLGRTSFARRMPLPAVGEAFVRAGIGIHFSGHWHVNDVAALRTGAGNLVNVSMPSLAGFPPASRILEADTKGLDLTTVTLAAVPGYDLAFSAYAREQERN